ncbi:SusD/RagB family nutrient-binding outer membrane lipoprotein [Chryseobacterium indoltheticum]|uniref:Starch-binding associating with outer membrane n=1 Tax=Chryseobacterium indoltheticum TaxID=254 RepID=A0A381F8R6_9FLAO|nr:SusD/RagB family nutrient-binding outer membrane lipoprotein [Chryseobacterium indoltheticum]AZA73172.1 SusD/RagB family nutrient-binding outer membrane lipoprotein [Chryseobacterium indoltheticum]SIP95987.1 Starch-binding associating with outer membrane [Chryseobacterium indoltheticum]SUX42858.1 Starch-binding associating with outer membrane [Chryseobacterium indoltheticum]
MKNNKFLITILAAALSFTATSCSNDYLDVNDNPNAVQAEQITPELMLPGAISQAYRTQAGTMMQFGNLMMNSWAGNSYTIAGPYSREFSLSSVDNTFYRGIWEGLYPRVANFDQMEKFTNNNHEQDYYIAIAKIMKAYYMQYIVDLYGDAPYNEAFMGQQNTTPKYDNDADIYKILISKLEEANALIDAADDNALEPVSDIVFHGDMDKWKALSNTIKLKLLVRMSKVTGDLATYRNTKLQTLATATFIDEEVVVNPGYSASSDDQMNPYILNWARNASGQQVSNYSVVVVSEHMANALEGNVILNSANYTKFTGLKDPRRTRLFTNVTSVDSNGNPFTGLKGVRQGNVPGQPGVPVDNVNTSKLGVGNFAGGNTPASTWTQIIDHNNGRGGVLFSKSESNLLQAEAALRWPAIFSFSPATKFNVAIIANATWLGANTTNAAWTTYITGIAARPGLGWTGTDIQKIEAIMTQKWIALTNINPTEMFIEYNRTGYPFTPMATTAQFPNKPYRLMYPNSEYAANSANVPNISSADVFVKNQYTPFWNQN